MGGLSNVGVAPSQLPYYDRPAEQPVATTTPVAAGTPPVTGTQSEDVIAAVDDTLSPDATPEQRQAAYEALQGVVDRAASGGDYEVIQPDSMRYLALYALRQESIPTKYSDEVLAAVDQELSPSASPEQQLEAYETIQEYVDLVGGIGDAGITAEALPTRTAALLAEAGLPTVAQDATAEAERILSLDGDAARAEAFAQAYASTESTAAREALTQAIFADGVDPLSSWLDPATVNGMVADGTLTDAQRGALAEAFTYAYNNDLVPGETRPANPGNIDYDWQENPDHNVEALPLDSIIYNYAGYGYDQRLEHAADVDALLEFLGSSDGPEVAQFREEYSQHLIETYVVDDNVQLSDDNASREAAAGLAALLMGGDPANPDIAVDVLARLTPEQRTTFFDYAADSKNLFGKESLEYLENYGDVSVDDVSQPDPLATVINAVANSDTYAAGDLAAEIARYPQSNSAWFGDDHDDRGFPQSGYESRADAMTALLAGHSDAILDALTADNDTGARSVDDTDLTHREANGRDLGALLELTVFNADADATTVAAARSEILDYVGEQSRAIDRSSSLPNSEGYLEASNRLVVLSAATYVAVDNGFEQLAADQKAQQEAIAFMVDLALAAVPLSSRLSSAASGTISELFANNPLVSEALDGLTGEVIDQATGQLTDAAKDQLYEALESDSDLAGLLERQTVADSFRDTLLTAIVDERDRAEIQRDAASLADDISEAD